MSVYKSTYDTSITNDVARTELITHIIETIQRNGLLVNTFLQQTEPKMSTAIFHDRIDLTSRQIHLHTEEWVINEFIFIWLIESYTLSIVTNDDAPKMIAIKGRDGMSICTLKMLKLSVLQTIHAGIRSTHINRPSLIFTETMHHKSLSISHIAFQLFPVITEKTSLVGHHPHTSLTIFNHGTNSVDTSNRTTNLFSMGFIRELHNTQSRSTHEHIAISPLQETISIAGTMITLKVCECHIIKLTAIPSLQCSIHTEIEQTVTILKHCIHVIASQCTSIRVLTLEHMELISIIAVNTVTSCNPDVSFTILIHLSNKTAGKLFVWIKKFTHLGRAAN